MQRFWPMCLTFSTLHILKLTFFAYISSKPISLKLIYCTMHCPCILWEGHKNWKKIFRLFLNLRTWQAYSKEVISNKFSIFLNLWPTQNIWTLWWERKTNCWNNSDAHRWCLMFSQFDDGFIRFVASKSNTKARASLKCFHFFSFTT